MKKANSYQISNIKKSNIKKSNIKYQISKNSYQISNIKEGRIPKDISYEALRLARTETSKAYWKGAVESARNSPSYKGTRWILNRSHPIADICDAYAAHEEGLGRGVYALGSEPEFPHPNCLCTIVAVHEQPEEFVEKLKRWQADPGSEPDLEKWYNDTHKNEILKKNAASGAAPQDKPPKLKYYIEIPDLPEAARVGLSKAWEEILVHGQEYGTEKLLHVHAATGESIFGNLSGTSSRIQFTPELIKFLKEEPVGSVLSIHNHPRSASFSPEDLSVLSMYKSIKYLTVIGHDGTRYVIKVGNGRRISLTTIRKRYNLIKQRTYAYFDQKIRNRLMTSQEAWKEQSHVIVTELAEQLGWEYTRY